MIVISLFASTLFLGGTGGPGSEEYWGLGIVWLLVKTIAFLFFYCWLRATLPRFRYDQLMGIAWKVLLPAVLVNVMLTALFRLRGNADITTNQFLAVVAVAVILIGGLFALNELSNKYADSEELAA